MPFCWVAARTPPSGGGAPARSRSDISVAHAGGGESSLTYRSSDLSDMSPDRTEANSGGGESGGKRLAFPANGFVSDPGAGREPLSNGLVEPAAKGLLPPRRRRGAGANGLVEAAGANGLVELMAAAPDFAVSLLECSSSLGKQGKALKERFA